MHIAKVSLTNSTVLPRKGQPYCPGNIERSLLSGGNLSTDLTFDSNFENKNNNKWLSDSSLITNYKQNINKNYRLSVDSAFQTSQNYIQITKPDDELSYDTSLSTKLMLEGFYLRNKDDYLVGTGTITELSGNTYSKRNLKINSEKKSLMSLSEITCFSWLTPQMDRLFQGETVTRRRFIDRLVYTLDPNHGKRVTSYEKLIRERSNLLKSNNFSGEWLSAIENSISEFGVAIAAGRKSMIAHLNSELINKKGVFLGARLDIEGYLENLLNHKPAIEVEDIFRDKLLNSRKTDAERGRTTSGPHRSDLIVYNLKNNLPASLCSTGEQKSLLIAIILAEAKIISSIRGGAPILLLDEIAAHLDSEHIKSLFEELRMLNSQIWITTTNKSLLEFIVPDFEVLNIINGTVEQIN